MEHEYKNKIHGSFIFMVATIITSFLHFVITTVLARTVPLETFGTFIFITNLVFLLSIIVTSFSSALSESVSSEKRKLPLALVFPSNKTLLKTYALSIIASGIWVLLVPYVSIATHIEAPILYVCTLIFLCMLPYGAYRGALGGHFIFTSLSLLIVIEALSRIGLILQGIFSGSNILIFISIPASIGIAFLLSYFFAHKIKSKAAASLHPITVPNKLFLSLFIISIASSIVFSLDMILVKFLFSPDIAGQYAFISTIGRILIIINGLISYLFILFCSNEQAPIQKKRIFNIISSIIILNSLGFIFLFGLLGTYTAPLLLGPNSLAIVPVLLPYTIALACASLSEIIIIYHILKKEYQYIWFILGTIFFVLGGIYLFHNTLAHVIYVLLTTTSVMCIGTIILHTYQTSREKNTSIFTLLLFFLKKAPVSGSHAILFMNRKSMTHPESGGAEIYLDEITQRLNTDTRPIICITNNEECREIYTVEHGIHYIRLGGFLSSYWLIPLYCFLKLRNHVAIVIDTHNAIPFFSPLYLNKKKIFLIIHHIHTNVFKKHLPFGLVHIALFLESYLMPRVYRKSKVITVSPSSYNEAQKIGFTKDQMTIIPNGVSIPKDYCKEEHPFPVISYIGRIEKYKRVDILLEALEHIHVEIPEAHLVIAGAGKQLDTIRMEVTKSRCSQKVSLCGFISEEDKASILSRSWIHVQPSETEGWGITIIEANAHQTPVVGFNVPGIADAIINHKTGMLCPEESVTSLCATILSLLKNESLRKNLGKEALKHADAFSWDKSAILFKKYIYEK